LQQRPFVQIGGAALKLKSAAQALPDSQFCV